MKRTGLLALSTLLAACGSMSLRDTPTPTVGSISTEHDPTSNILLRQVLVKTPSTLSIRPSKPISPQPGAALDHYDALLDLDADPALRAEALRRSADLRLQAVDAGEAGADDLASAIAAYEELRDRYPDYPLGDRVLYQLARAQQLAGDTKQATASLQQLGQRYPQSLRNADARFRAAELLYQSRDYAQAQIEYRAVVDFGTQTSLFEAAQYKYGWALYQQHKYGEALPVFLAILERELPRGVLEDPQAALAAVDPARSEVAGEALRVTGLSFAALGGGVAINEYLAQQPQEPRYATLLYAALATSLLDKQRYSDAAETYTAFIERHPRHPRAPEFQTRVIEAYRGGGFGERVLAAKEMYVQRYAHDTGHWAGQPPAPDVAAQLRAHLDDLARYYHAQAQQTPAGLERERAFVVAAAWYRRILDLYPEDPRHGDSNLLYADALLDGGQVAEAAEQYQQTAYAPAHAGYVRAPEAAYAAVLVRRRLAEQAAPGARSAALRASIDAALQLADRFQDHPQRAAVLAHAAGDLLETGAHEEAIAVARRVLDVGRDAAPLAPGLRQIALSALADAHYARAEYAQAESAYQDLLAVTPVGDAERGPAVERFAASIYKQAEAQRGTGDLAAAAATFLRVGQSAPQASIRANADYDAAAAFIAVEHWTQAAIALEGFRERFPGHALMGEADKKLAVAYQKDGNLAAAAAAYARIARRVSEDEPTRRSAAWLVAQLYDQARMSGPGEQAYAFYLAQFPQPLDASLSARRRLADLALEARNDTQRYRYWLAQIVDVDRSAGAARNERTRQMAAQASLEIGRVEAADARRVALAAPVDKTLPRRRAATEAAIAALVRAADYGYAEITTAATFELATVYRDLGRALIESTRPRELKGEALEQYEILLEEQAYPFEERAIKAHEANLARIGQGVWNDWVRRSVYALAELAPAKYGKHEHRETSYDSPT